jgi:acetylornithine deacetylase/succinyl-diaminopimelate desuccinylase-like protein
MHDDLARDSRTLPADPPDAPALADAARQLLRRPAVRRAVQFIRADDERTLAEQVRLASTPAPPFSETARGEGMAQLMEAAGTGPASTDEVGNVRAWVGEPGDRPLVISAHLDTVFPPEQEIRIRREGDRWVGPGISDDARGLAVLLAVIRALPPLPRPPLLAVATVGEEGIGDLRGVRHLFGPEGSLREARGFISLDGAGTARVIAGGVGSRRFRVTVGGPGGHSWVDWGRVNPIHILAETLAEAERITLPRGATFNVGRIGGGTSVNAIPTSAWCELEFRSEDEDALARLERRLRSLLERVVELRNTGRPPGPEEEASLKVERIGHRPAGHTDPATPLVRSAVAATRAVVGRATPAASSTDANYPMNVGIPAITLGAGGEAGLAHTPDEWYRNVHGPDGTLRALLTLLMMEPTEAV